MKRFYSLQLKDKKENIPVYIATHLLKKESPLIKYLSDYSALKFVYRKSRNLLECYAEEKYLMVGKLKYPDIFGRKGRMGFMELYISHQLQKHMELSKGST